MEEALEIAALGVTTVFVVLGSLMIALRILGAVASRIASLQKKKE